MADAPVKVEEKTGPPDPRGQYVHLHTHSHYSQHDGLSKVDEMVKLDRVADKVLAYRARARTKKAKKRQRKARKAQRDSCI